MNRTALLAVAFIVVVIIAVVYLTTGLRRYRCEVCITFRGQTECRRASGPSQEAAQRAAAEGACASLASGVGESIACSQTPPDRVTWSPP